MVAQKCPKMPRNPLRIRLYRAKPLPSAVSAQLLLEGDTKKMAADSD
jgi:hypothetical protein